MDGMLESALGFMGDYLFELLSLLIAAAALLYAALAFRVAKQAIQTAKDSDLAALKLKAHEGRARAERSFLSLQSACKDIRSQWNIHHDRHFPKLGANDYRRDDTHHISEAESEGRKLLMQLALGPSELGKMDAAALEKYIHWTDETALKIEHLAARLCPPQQHSA